MIAETGWVNKGYSPPIPLLDIRNDSVDVDAEKPKPHIASIDTYSKPAILYAYMWERQGRWISGGTLARLIRSNALSSHISAVRQQLRLHPELGLECPRAQQRGVGRFFYCVMEVGA